jgi:hypothetical protein
MTKSVPFIGGRWWELKEILSNNQPFHNSTGKFRGVLNDPEIPTLPGYGQMSEADRNRMRLTHDLYGIDYIVFSYATPIAYRNRHGVWTVPNAGYSQTTKAKHLSPLRPAVSAIMDELEISA